MASSCPNESQPATELLSSWMLLLLLSLLLTAAWIMSYVFSFFKGCCLTCSLLESDWCLVQIWWWGHKLNIIVLTFFFWKIGSIQAWFCCCLAFLLFFLPWSPEFLFHKYFCLLFLTNFSSLVLSWSNNLRSPLNCSNDLLLFGGETDSICLFLYMACKNHILCTWAAQHSRNLFC